MSEENVEIVRRHIEAFRQGDAPGALSHLDPHVVWDASRIALLDVRVAYGHEEFSQTIRHYIGAFEDYDYEVGRLTDLGSGAVLAVVTRGRTGQEQRCSRAAFVRPALHRDRREDRADHLLSKRGRGPRSRRAVGVGDV